MVWHGLAAGAFADMGTVAMRTAYAVLPTPLYEPRFGGCLVAKLLYSLNERDTAAVRLAWAFVLFYHRFRFVVYLIYGNILHKAGQKVKRLER